MLMALGLDPSYTYTDYELQSAWRRRMAQVHPDRGGNPAVAAAVNVAYISLIGCLKKNALLDVVL
jgi:hypothetical protein